MPVKHVSKIGQPESRLIFSIVSTVAELRPSSFTLQKNYKKYINRQTYAMPISVESYGLIFPF